MSGGHLVTDDGVELWYRRLGDGRDPLVVPGAVVDADLEDLAGVDRQVVFVDPRNRGRSATVTDPARLGFHREVQDLEVVRMSLRFETMSVLATSYLAGVAARYAVEHPARVTRLVLVNPIGPVAGLAPPQEPDPGALARLDQLRAGGLPERDPRAYCEEWRRVYLAAQVGDPEALERIRSRPCAHPNEWPDHVTRALAHVFVDLGLHDWRPELGRLEIPTLVLQSDLGGARREVAEQWILALPDARLVMMEEVGRHPWVEAPERFFPVVDTFLGGAWPNGAVR